MNVPIVLSILYHSLDDSRGIAEERTPPWNYRAAWAITKYLKIPTIAIRPTELEQPVVKILNNVVVVLLPYHHLNIPLPKMVKSTIAALQPLERNIKYIYDLVKNIKKDRQQVVYYIHEYKNIYNIPFYLDRDSPFILQQHSRKPFEPKVADIIKIRLLRGLEKTAFYALSIYEKESLQSLGFQHVYLRPMGVAVDQIPLVEKHRKYEIREKLGLPTDRIIITTYVSTPIYKHGELFDVKGSHLLPHILRYLSTTHKNTLLVVFNLRGDFANYLRKMGATVYPYVSQAEFFQHLAASDLYILPATDLLKYSGINIAVVEAMAMGKPVLSPTLIHLPDLRLLPTVGIAPPYINNINKLNIFLKKLTEIIENINKYKPAEIREVAQKFYSWETFANDFKDTLHKIA
ncbi:glycosyltransferase [Pyrobaculum sp. 3827-6]|uniref:glycosyltransferase n=1 Tax=Pyrobaculum sp. 3827-6 TaxID=2983604 RepID=UPI0021D8C8C1|nr:glycosyltransferase [Pyrobaculum sp. 3827-6]MCU7787756.1 glycosyltransferase [Pyrobaculum sp. 3827-6]